MPASRMVWLTLALVVVGLVGVQATLYMSYFYAPVQVTQGSLWVVDPDGGVAKNLYESYRIFFIHLPSAYATALCCALAAIGGVGWLVTRKAAFEALVVSSAEVGMFVGLMVLLTGTFWADYAWASGRLGSGWNWEPRLTTMLILWLAFAALLVLRRAMDTDRQRAMITAVYGILLGPLYPLVSKAIEIGQTSHPKSFDAMLSAPEIAATKNVAQIGVLVALMALVAVRFLYNRLGQQLEEVRQ